MTTRRGRSFCWFAGIVLLTSLAGRAAAADAPEPEKAPVILDCDIGTDIDDTFAVALALLSPELDLRGITTVSGDTVARAKMVCRMLTAAKRRDVPVAPGAADKPPQDLRGMQGQYANHPAVIFNRTAKPAKESAVEFLYAKLKAEPGKITIITVGPLSNLAQLLTEHPDCKPWIKRVVMMGGSVRVGYNNQAPPQAEFNIRADAEAARVVFTSGVPLVVAPLDATTMLKLDAAALERIFGTNTLLNQQVQSLFQLWDQKSAPVMYDPVAVALTVTEKFCRMEDLRLEVDAKGMTRIVDGAPNARVATGIDEAAFLKWFVDRFAAVSRDVPEQKPVTFAKLLPAPTKLPARVHTFEDYETDIEKRWWMSGKGETASLPPHSTRACRGVLTEDFDDRMGNLTTLFTAVVFNPVPGPPMGERTRLSFRYRLKGTDTVRVQIYSLTNGYHRCLTLTGLPQERWESGVVDMTQVRRPDGSGGPLSKDERIDDIQFYVDPRAEILIDDVVLYDEAPESETKPFPKRLLFTGWFDTGTQGKEWPGTFEIVPHTAPRSWKMARSVPNPETSTPWIRLSLRGERPYDGPVQLRFRYRLTGATSLKVELANTNAKQHVSAEARDLKQDEWSEAELTFPTEPSGESQKPRTANELRFLLPAGAVLELDDVLLYQ